MYHTNQSTHLQGGEDGNGDVHFWADYMKDNIVGIKETNTLVIYTGVTTRARSSSGDLNCEHYSYTNLKRTRYLIMG